MTERDIHAAKGQVIGDTLDAGKVTESAPQAQSWFIDASRLPCGKR